VSQDQPRVFPPAKGTVGDPLWCTLGCVATSDCSLWYVLTLCVDLVNRGAYSRRAASCTSLWTGSSCLMNPPTKPMTMTGGIVPAAALARELLRAPGRSLAPRAGTAWPSAKMAASEKIEAQIGVRIRRNEIAFICDKYPRRVLSLFQCLNSDTKMGVANGVFGGVALFALGARRECCAGTSATFAS
jgi:hypothetical protein